MSLTKQEVEVLRTLGAKYMERATLPIQKEKIRMWKSLNRGRMERPMITIDELPLHELNNRGELACVIADPYWRRVEYNLRLAIYRWDHFAVDMVLDPVIEIPKLVTTTGYGLQVKENIVETDKNNSVVAHHYVNQLLDEEDLEKIKPAQIRYDRAGTREHMQEAEQIFQGIGPIMGVSGLKDEPGIYYNGIWDYLTLLMGVEDIYMDLIDRPEFLHAICEKMTQSVLAGIRQMNELELIDDNQNISHCSYIYTDELLPDSCTGKGPHSKNTWMYTQAQLFTSCSPATTEEFDIPYISRIAEQFGMIYYGCCERLDDRLDIIKKIPNVKKISCSPWSDRRHFAEQIGSKIVMSFKPTPAFLAGTSMDADVIRKDLQFAYDVAKENGANLEILLKDISTVKYQPERITEWSKIAMEVVCQ